jgi:hypothetical protein
MFRGNWDELRELARERVTRELTFSELERYGVPVD